MHDYNMMHVTHLAHNRQCTVYTFFVLVCTKTTRVRPPHVMNNGNGTLCCNMNQNHECCLCNYLVGLLMQGNETLCSRIGMCFRNETLCCMVWNVFYCYTIWPACMLDGILHTQSGSDLATQSLVPILKVVYISPYSV